MFWSLNKTLSRWELTVLKKWAATLFITHLYNVKTFQTKENSKPTIQTHHSKDSSELKSGLWMLGQHGYLAVRLAEGVKLNSVWGSSSLYKGTSSSRVSLTWQMMGWPERKILRQQRPASFFWFLAKALHGKMKRTSLWKGYMGWPT